MKKFVAVGLSGLALAGVAAGCGSSGPSAQQVAQHKAQQQAAARKVEQDRKAADRRAEQQLQRAIRTQAIKDLEHDIKKDATKEVNNGYLTGPILRATCSPATAADANSLQQATFSCLAIDKTNDDGTSEGYTYTGTINYNTGMMQWHLGGGGITP